jgi:hypothetical protein
MLEISIIQKPLDNHIEFEWNFKFLVKILKVHVDMVVIPLMWWLPNWFQHLHYVAFDVKFIFFRKINEVPWKLGWNMSYLVFTKWGFISWSVQFGGKFRFLLKIYVLTWKLGWIISYLVATRWVLFANLLSSVSN